VPISASVANPKFAAEHAIRQWTLICCSQFNFGSELQIHCRHYNFGGESQIHCRTPNSASNVNSLLTNSISTVNYKFTADVTTSATNPKFAAGHIIRQRILIRCPQFNFGSNPKFVAGHTIQQQILIHCSQFYFSSELQIHCKHYNFDSESQIHCRTPHNSISATNHKFAAEHTYAFSIPAHTISSNLSRVTWF
jgi:hypothetical protein